MLGDDTIHCQRVSSTPDKAAAYCKKTESRVAGPWEWGKVPDKRGKKAPLEDAIRAIKAGSSLDTIATEYPSVFVHSYRGLAQLHTILNTPKGFMKPTKVTVLWGPTRTGKTFRAMSATCADGRVPFKMPLSSGFWFDGYAGQDTLVIDDFYGQIRFSDMLQLLDDKHLQVPVKGGFVQGLWTKVYITSNSHPDEWWKDARASIPAWSIAAMMQRLGSIEYMDKPWTAVVDDDIMTAPVASPPPVSSPVIVPTLPAPVPVRPVPVPVPATSPLCVPDCPVPDKYKALATSYSSFCFVPKSVPAKKRNNKSS